jgi:pimeloyl-ACP methyl ester carboxylesterase
MRTALGLAIVILASTRFSHAQSLDFACMPDNSLQPEKEGLIYMDPVVWAPGHSYTVTITGTFPIADNCQDTEVSVSAWEWPNAPDWWEVGPAATYINLSNLTWVSATQTTFDVSVDGGAPSGNLFFELASVPGFENYWQVGIQPPPPPNPPSPPPGPSLPCPNPVLDPDNPVTPDTWIPGQTYQITVKGTGFTTKAMSSLPYCPATTITLSVDTGTVDLTNIVVVNSTTITATVAPANTDPAEPVTIMIWGPPEFDDDDDDQGMDSAAPQPGAPAGALIDSATVQLPASATLQFPDSATLQVPVPPGSLFETASLEAPDAVLLREPADEWQPAPVPVAAPSPQQSTPTGPSGMVYDGQTKAQLARLYIIDPYLIKSVTQNNSTISNSSVITAISNTSKYAKGLVADGTSTGIVVFGPLKSKREVDFVLTGNATLVNWSNSFLAQPPATGQSSLPVTNILSVSGKYYAFALIQAPSALDPYGRSVSVQANIGTGGSIGDLQYLSLRPPAVILVHGIWGGLDSLTSGSGNIQSYLLSSGNYLPNWVIPICYSRYLPWYATANLAGFGTCDDNTSANQMAAAIQQAYSAYDNTQTVGGRVDVVAHSMGGLATLNYASLPGYQKDYRSRNQGAVHNLITIDTPVAGSPFADFVIQKATAGYQPTASLISTGLWLLKCPTATSLQLCMTSLNMPVTAPNLASNLSSGAVYSLKPTVVRANLSITDIPNGNWAEVYGQFPDSTKPYSLLRNVLGVIIGGIYPKGQTQPTITQILQGQLNDVIVPVNSQIAGGTSTTFSAPGPLQHTNTPGAGDLLSYIQIAIPSTAGYIVDNDVLHSEDVNEYILNTLQPGTTQ